MTTKKNIKNILRKNKPEVVRKFKLKDKIKRFDFKGLAVPVGFSLVIILFAYFIFFRGGKMEDNSSIIQSGVEDLKNGDIEKAGYKFEKVLRDDNGNLEAIYQLAIVKYNKKEREEAIHDLSVVTKLDPENEKANNVLGNIYRDLEQYDEAVSNYSEAIKKNPKFISPYVNLAVLLTDMNRKEEAMTIVAQGLENFPDSLSLKRLEKSLSIDLRADK